jgi:hypothetical protein
VPKQEGTAADFTRDAALRFEKRKRIAHRRPRHAEINAELALGRQARAARRADVLRPREYELGEREPAFQVSAG